jgi:ribonuclease HI
MKQIKAYTDGSAAVAGVNKGKGGFGTYFPDLFGNRKAFSLGFKQAKTGEMEVMALLFAIKAMPLKSEESLELLVYSDSEYVVKTFVENRIEKWIANDWRNSSGIVKNLELWKAVMYHLEKRKYLKLTMTHIRSHQLEKEKDPEKLAILKKCENIRGNLMADKLADYKRHEKLFKNTFEINLK